VDLTGSGNEFSGVQLPTPSRFTILYVCICLLYVPRSIYHNVEQDTLGALKSLSVETLELQERRPRAKLMATADDSTPTLNAPFPATFTTRYHCSLSHLSLGERQQHNGPTESNYDIKIFVNCKM